MDMKTVCKRVLIALLVVLLGIEVCMELRYPCDELFLVSKNTEKILRRTPEVSVTEEDKALVAELLAVPSVQALVESGENGDIPAAKDPDVAETAGKHLDGESAKSLNVSAMFFEDGFVSVASWREDGRVFLVQAGPEEGAYYKIYSPKRGTSYENWNNERAQKSEVHRRWFAWLRDGLWKDGE